MGKRAWMLGAVARVCSACGWEGECDRHREEPSKGYVPGNVRVLCPNCHRAAHGKGSWNQPQTYERPLSVDSVDGAGVSKGL